jgi:hypothetical protein
LEDIFPGVLHLAAVLNAWPCMNAEVLLV